MKLRSAILILFAAALASAAGLDGTWTSEMKMRGGKKGGGQDRTVPLTMTLKSDNGQITGTVVTGNGKRSQNAQIQNGKLDGNSFSFVTVRTTKKGEQKMEWRGTLDNDTLQGTCAREGGKRRRGQSFTAKRT